MFVLISSMVYNYLYSYKSQLFTKNKKHFPMHFTLSLKPKKREFYSQPISKTMLRHAQTWVSAIPDGADTLYICACGGGAGVLGQGSKEEVNQLHKQRVVTAHHQESCNRQRHYSRWNYPCGNMACPMARWERTGGCSVAYVILLNTTCYGKDYKWYQWLIRW